MELNVNEVLAMVMGYLKRNRPEAMKSEREIEIITSAFIAGYKAAHGLDTFENRNSNLEAVKS